MRYDISTWTPLLPDTGSSAADPPAAAKGPKGSLDASALQALREVLAEMQHHLEEENLELGFFVSLGPKKKGKSIDFSLEKKDAERLVLVCFNGDTSELKRGVSSEMFDYWRGLQNMKGKFWRDVFWICFVFFDPREYGIYGDLD